MESLREDNIKAGGSDSDLRVTKGTHAIVSIVFGVLRGEEILLRDGAACHPRSFGVVGLSVRF